MLNLLLIVISLIIVVCLVMYIITPTATLFKFLISIERSIARLYVNRLTIDDVEIEYLRGGSGEPLLLLHGFGGDKDHWNRIAGYLGDHFDVIAIDLPGFGNSSGEITQDYDVKSQISRLKKIVDALELTEFHLTGSSMGGYLAGHFAAMYPNQIKNLWLISPLGVENSDESEMFKVINAGLHPIILPRTGSEFNALFANLFVKRPFVPSVVIAHLATMAEQRIDLNTKIFNQIHPINHDGTYSALSLEKALHNYQGTVLITWGNKDRILDVSGALGLKQVLPDAHIDILNNVGHLPMLEQPFNTAQPFIALSKGKKESDC